jgi:proline dehydrogenase
MNPISAVILKMSESPAWERRISGWRTTRRVVERFMPGEHLDDAVAAARRINERGMSTSLNPVGEHVHDEDAATAATDAYVQILERIKNDGLDSNMSVKLSLLGLDLGTTTAADNLTRILEAAEARGLFVRIDMESSTYVDRTLEIYEAARARFDGVGVVVQSYLRRSADDVEKLARTGAAVRLVKGAYKEPPDIAFADKADVDRSFEQLTARMLADDARANGVALAVATHDRRLVESAEKMAAERGVETGLEFQMLYGIARDLQDDTAAGRFPVRIYISYGVEWYPWFMRRLAERPANLTFFLKHLAR